MKKQIHKQMKNLEMAVAGTIEKLGVLLAIVKLVASNIAPIEENNQPRILTSPYNAKLAGRRNIPDPIIFPTTSEALDQNPKL